MEVGGRFAVEMVQKRALFPRSVHSLQDCLSESRELPLAIEHCTGVPPDRTIGGCEVKHWLASILRHGHQALEVL